MLGRVTLWLLWLAAALLFVVGVPAFVAPAWGSAEFPWSVGPLLAQTIGGWSVGTAAMAVLAARARTLDRAYAAVIYCGLFGIGQLIVVIAFLDRLQTAHLLTWPYLGAMLSLSGAGVSGALDAIRAEGRRNGDRERRVPAWARVLAVLVGGFVLLLGIGTLLAGPDGATARGAIFPEQMGLFSIRAFSAFLFAIGVAIVSLLPARSMRPYRVLAMGGLYLIVPITVAALLNLSLFDFAARPGGLFYIVAYVVVGAVLAVALATHSPGRNPEAEPSEG